MLAVSLRRWSRLLEAVVATTVGLALVAACSSSAKPAASGTSVAPTNSAGAGAASSTSADSSSASTPAGSAATVSTTCPSAATVSRLVASTMTLQTLTGGGCLYNDTATKASLNIEFVTSGVTAAGLQAAASGEAKAAGGTAEAVPSLGPNAYAWTGTAPSPNNVPQSAVDVITGSVDTVIVGTVALPKLEALAQDVISP